jgi:short-subunit dehydrogenase
VSLVSGNVLITGATGGIGHALARAFAARDANLLLTGRRLEVLESLTAELGGRALACDLANRKNVEQLAELAVEAKLDVFVANAALPATGLLTELTQQQVDRMLEVNLRAPVALSHALVPGMVDRGRGHIVFISSLAAKAANYASSLYSATKFGLRGFALSLREDLRRDGIGVSSVLPGFISDAGLFADAQANVEIELPPGVTTRSPEQVAVAVIKAIERNRAEVQVAPPFLRFGATFAGAAPRVAAAASRAMGANRLAAAFAEGQRDKRE